MSKQTAYKYDSDYSDGSADLEAIQRLAHHRGLVSDHGLASRFVRNVNLLADEMLTIDTQIADRGRLETILSVSEILLSRPNRLSDKRLFDIITGVARIGAGRYYGEDCGLAQKAVNILERAYFEGEMDLSARYVILDELEEIALGRQKNDGKPAQIAARCILGILFKEKTQRLKECACEEFASLVLSRRSGQDLLADAKMLADEMEDQRAAVELLTLLAQKVFDAALPSNPIEPRRLYVNSTSEPIMEIAQFCFEANASGAGRRIADEKLADAYFAFVNHAIDSGQYPTVFIRSFEKMLESKKTSEYVRCRMIYALGKIMYRTLDTKLFHDSKEAFEKHGGDVAHEFLQAMRNSGWEPAIMREIGTNAMLCKMEISLELQDRNMAEQAKARMEAYRRKLSGLKSPWDTMDKKELGKLFPKDRMSLN